MPGHKLRRFNQGSPWALQTQLVSTFDIVAGKWEITKIHHCAWGMLRRHNSIMPFSRRPAALTSSSRFWIAHHEIPVSSCVIFHIRSTVRNKMKIWLETMNKFSIKSTQIIHIHHRSRTRHQDCEWPDRNGADGSTRSRDKAVEWTPRFIAVTI